MSHFFKKFQLSILLFIITLLIIPTSFTFATPTTATPTDELASLLSSFQGMTAQFKQVVAGNKKIPGQTSTGKMALQRPGKFRWDVQQPNPQLLIADGRYLWIYDVDLEQATRQKLDTSNTSSPASLLSGSVSSLRDRFDVARLPESGNMTGFRLKPFNNSDLFQWIELYFTDGKLSKMLLQDNLGALNTFYFSNVQMNPALKASLFQFNPPKGVEVIKN